MDLRKWNPFSGGSQVHGDVLTELDRSTTQVQEVIVENFISQFNHTFNRPEAPDSLNWTSTNVTADRPEVKLTGTANLTSNERGRYAPGSEAIPGVAFKLDGDPGTGEEAEGGYFTSDFGISFGVDDTDAFARLRQNSGNTTTVHESDWNGTTPPNFDNFKSHIRVCRFEHLFYGGGGVDMQILGFENDENGNPTIPKLYTVHTFSPQTEGHAPFDEPNLPVQFDTTGLTPDMRVRAAHYEKGEQEADFRSTGEHRFGQSVGTSGWTPLISWKKRTDWETINVRPAKFAVAAASNPIKLEVQLDTSLGTNADFSTATNGSSSETATEFDTTATSITTTGERRWVGQAIEGQGSSTGPGVRDDLNFNLPSGQVATLAAQAVGGSATVYTTVMVGEEF